jgi:hypothetical protein
MTARFHALLALALLAACSSPTADPVAARVAAPAQVPLPVVSEEPPAAAPEPAPSQSAPVEPAPAPPIGAPLALAPLNPDPILARATPDAAPPPAAPLVADPPMAPASVDEIRLVQETLADQHLYHGPFDGLLTAELRASVLQYQRRKGLPETAQLDAETLRRLDADASGDETVYGAGETGAKPSAGGER